MYFNVAICIDIANRGYNSSTGTAKKSLEKIIGKKAGYGFVDVGGEIVMFGMIANKPAPIMCYPESWRRFVTNSIEI
jgi:hypothetical protein